MKEYIFRTKFACDKNRNGEKVVILKNIGEDMLLVRFVKDNTEKKIYNTELEEEK